MAYDSSVQSAGPGNDMYSDADMGPESESAEPSESEGQTSVIPKSLCPGMKPGEEIVLKIVRVTDDSYEVAYAPEKGKEEESPAPEQVTPPESSSTPMASMLE